MFRIRPWGRVFLRFRLLYGNTVKMHVWVCVNVVVSVIRQIFTTGLPEYAENVNNTEFRCVFVSFPILVGRRKPRFYRFFPVEMFLQKNCNSITKFNGLAAAAQWAIFSRLFFYQIRIFHVKYGPFFLRWNEWIFWVGSIWSTELLKKNFPYKSAIWNIRSALNVLYRFCFTFHKTLPDARYTQNRSIIAFMELSIHTLI